MEKIDNHLGEHHSVELKRESFEARAERIIVEELRQIGWTNADFKLSFKSDLAKLRIASRLRRETALPIRWIADRLSMGAWKSATTRLHHWNKRNSMERVLRC